MMKKKKPLAITENDFVASSFDDIMTHSYGIKGTYTRELAEIKIKAVAKNITILNKLKEDTFDC